MFVHFSVRRFYWKGFVNNLLCQIFHPSFTTKWILVLSYSQRFCSSHLPKTFEKKIVSGNVLKLIFFISIIKIKFFIWLVINEKPSSGIIHQSKLSLLGCSHTHTHKNYSPPIPLHHPLSWRAWKGWEKPKEMAELTYCALFALYFW